MMLQKKKFQTVLTWSIVKQRSSSDALLVLNGGIADDALS